MTPKMPARKNYVERSPYKLFGVCFEYKGYSKGGKDA